MNQMVQLFFLIAQTNTMKKYPIIGLVLLWFSSLAMAQTTFTTFEETLVVAKEQQKNVLMVFSGSDWCKPCMQLKKNILMQPEFDAFKEDNLTLLEVDFPYRRKNRLPKEQRKYNEQLAEKYNQEGSFPKVVLFDANGDRIGEVSAYPTQTPKEFIYQIEVLKGKHYN